MPDYNSFSVWFFGSLASLVGILISYLLYNFQSTVKESFDSINGSMKEMKVSLDHLSITVAVEMKNRETLEKEIIAHSKAIEDLWSAIIQMKMVMAGNNCYQKCHDND